MPSCTINVLMLLLMSKVMCFSGILGISMLSKMILISTQRRTVVKDRIVLGEGRIVGRKKKRKLGFWHFGRCSSTMPVTTTMLYSHTL